MGGWDASGTKPLTSSAFFILMALADGPRHGLGIADEVEHATDGQVTLGPGTLYNALRRMKAAGLIRESAERPDPGEDDPRRRYYRITEQGRGSLASEVSRLESVMRAVRSKDLLTGDVGS